MGKKKSKKAETENQYIVPESYIEEGELVNIGENLGEVKISNEVVMTISSIAASKVEGVHSAGGKSFFGKRDMERGISASVEGNHAVINVEVKIDYGKNIYDTVHKLRKI
ncbi:Asp23/Gls24 family envelope stress response protein [Candidatus Sumerlaeota bacterium]|nr:Asp23/Gls24 family envelope stress response protein [Candidatus Sumerlaeota bacterium]